MIFGRSSAAATTMAAEANSRVTIMNLVAVVDCGRKIEYGFCQRKNSDG